jgi:hypothetical protein
MLSCDIAPWVGLGLGCVIEECIESCMALGLGDWADAIADMLPRRDGGRGDVAL